MRYLSSVYFVNQPLHVSGIFEAHHQEVYCIYTTTGTCCAFQLTVCWPGLGWNEYGLVTWVAKPLTRPVQSSNCWLRRGSYCLYRWDRGKHQAATWHFSALTSLCCVDVSCV